MNRWGDRSAAANPSMATSAGKSSCLANAAAARAMAGAVWMPYPPWPRGGFLAHLRTLRARLGSISLMDALRKMSLMPAVRLEKSTLAAHRKGRLQEGADADIVVFNPQTVADRATYQSPREPSVGMQYVIVNGSVLIDAGHFVAGSFPGRAIELDPAKRRSNRDH
jgi:N-acyl-D-aspartate/D-glutamate deacylase